MDDSIHRYVTNDLLVRAQDVANTVGAGGNQKLQLLQKGN